MKTKILLSAAIVGVTAICSGAGGAAGGKVVGPVGTPTSATPQPTTSQTPELTLPPAGAPVQPNVSANPNISGNFNNRFAHTNSLYTITNPPGQLNSQSFGNPPGGGTVMPLQPGMNSQAPAGNSLPSANSPLPATIAPPPGGNTSPNIMPPAGANSAPAPVTAPSPGINNNSTPPSP